MQNEKVARIRILTRDIHNDVICLYDIIEKCLELSQAATTLEVENNKKALEDLKRGAKEARDLSILYYERLLHEVQPEVIAHFERNRPAPRGKPIQETLKEQEQNKSNNLNTE